MLISADDHTVSGTGDTLDRKIQGVGRIYAEYNAARVRNTEQFCCQASAGIGLLCCIHGCLMATSSGVSQLIHS